MDTQLCWAQGGSVSPSWDGGGGLSVWQDPPCGITHPAAPAWHHPWGVTTWGQLFGITHGVSCTSHHPRATTWVALPDPGSSHGRRHPCVIPMQLHPVPVPVPGLLEAPQPRCGDKLVAAGGHPGAQGAPTE